MKDKVYLRFSPQIFFSSNNSKKSFFDFFIKFLPKQNTDFEDKIDLVCTWVVECDQVIGITEREVGLNNRGIVIVKMPYKGNYGYWTDNTFLHRDFIKKLNALEVDKKYFEECFDALV